MLAALSFAGEKEEREDSWDAFYVCSDDDGAAMQAMAMAVATREQGETKEARRRARRCKCSRGAS